MAFETKLPHAASLQHLRIRRAMRRVTGHAAFRLERRVLVGERSLLIRVTLNAGGVRAGCEPRLLELETAVRVVAVAALHRTFEYLVMKRLVEVGLNFVMATDAELRLAGF